ncbi:3-phosphoshikimate 1-carboxyvinyltransferase [Arcanobacterium wilhelmae]|uniref:3-phosphoshikimate 1-carboxyvinyltransferase n=1 Tax=Arcanobacterium wilhelmae TaxID=1803177 RepID=A0ABT9NA17_9ACTO|nr:3-phosphoshikimate 1-carboxyvinyltransferase [Arcanobacterium wilhelmae]MDP9800531.1 3-phosphoshikimate 1-carboxyvinyltransferase [Arcanobacterium wilhelmae]WFN89947.1 3-phosphoshikimate 1-carboxyvinyltransferase [Arcanobacterium wilhelmae]
MSWCAPRASAIRARVELPGSKSLTNRYLVLAGLGSGPAVIRHPLMARDTALMAGALEALGVRVERGEDEWRVSPGPLRGARLDVGLSGTVMRFLTPLAAFARGEVILDGDLAARARPMAGQVAALRRLGVRIEGDSLPLAMFGEGRVSGGEVEIDASASSQFVSGLLLAAPRMDRGLTLRHVGGALPSLPHIRMTLECLARTGINAREIGPGAWRVEPGEVRLGSVEVEPDLTNAGPFLAAAMVTGGEVKIPWPTRTTQAGDSYRNIFERMGARVSFGGGELRLCGPQRIEPLELDAHDVGELVPTLAAVALFATGTSRFTGVGHLRGHETDRLAALAQSLTALGACVETGADWLEIVPPTSPGPAALKAYGDHRMATFAAIAGLRTDVTLDHVEETAKTLPQFEALWAKMINDSESE